MSKVISTGARLDSRDQVLVDEAIVALRHLWTQGYLSTVVAVGDYLIAHFFDGSLELAGSFAPTKLSALSHLMARADELPISSTQLRVAVRIAAQYRELRPAVADALSVTHHGLLLLVGDGRTKEELAARAVEERLTKRQLEKLIRRVQPRHAGGRPATLPQVRWAQALERIVDAEQIGGAFDLAALAEVPDDELVRVEKTLREARVKLARLLDACARRRRRARD